MASRYEEHRPRHAPRRYVACVWTQVNAGAGVHRQLVVPDGCVDLLWWNGQLQVVGPDRGPWVAPLASGDTIAGVRLRPGAAQLLLGRMSAERVRDLRVSPADVGVAEVAPLVERLDEASPRQAAELLDEFAAGLARRYRPDAAVEQVVAVLRRGGAPRVSDLADQTGLSERQLRRRFTDAVGYGPKTLHGILRFQRALHLARSTTGSLADVAYEAGYADQAHFTREVRRLADTTPRRLLRSAG